MFWLSASLLLASSGGSQARQLITDSESEVRTTMSKIQQSHIEANVPEAKDFQKFLSRDLQKYFGGLLKRRVRVKFELLRSGPTQSGVSYPKYYAWVKIYGADQQLIEQGAVRIAAEDKTDFSITDFWNVQKIRGEQKNLELVFPENLCGLIIGKSKEESDVNR